jgi:hypothetical protein
MRSKPIRKKPQQGFVLGIVIMLGVAILILGMAMLSNSGNLLLSTVDSKQRIRAKYAAESMVALQIARTMEQSSVLFGSGLDLPGTPLGSLLTGNGERGAASIVNANGSSGPLIQELITSGRFKGMMGIKIPLVIKALGQAPGGAKSRIDAEVKVYQVPIFQYGIFYEGDLEVTPGPWMSILGPVHTNSNAYFRTSGGLYFQGPVTASGDIFQWTRTNRTIRYAISPDTSAVFEPSLTTEIVAMDAYNRPAPIGGQHNVDFRTERLNLPIGGAIPEKLIAPRDSSDPPQLAKQQFDRRIPCNADGTCPSNRFVAEHDAKPLWISGPKVFYDRREKRWVKVWDFDVALMANHSRDSVFYLADTTTDFDKGTRGVHMLNAFRLINASILPRNLSIASANPMYIMGDFNLANPGGSCGPSDFVGSIPDSLKYCNAMIAADAITVLSPRWPLLDFATRGMSGSLEQDIANPHWTSVRLIWNSRRGANDTLYNPEPTHGYGDDHDATGYSPTIRINAAILTGNKPTAKTWLPPNNTDNLLFEAKYEGGVHNTVRYLENLLAATVVLKGSFVCTWKATFKGLDTVSTRTTIGGYYGPPSRIMSFDPRFRNLNNMPPATPFLSTGILSGWSEKR